MNLAKLVLLYFITVNVSFLYASTLSLDQEEIFIGSLEQERGMPAEQDFIIKRDSKTPEKVTVSFNFKFKENVCSEFGTDYGDIFPDPNNPNFPFPFPIPGNYCVGSTEITRNHTKKIVLDFDNAYNLDEGENETFSLSLVQKNFRSPEVKLNATVINAKGPYQIKKRGHFQKDGLTFNRNY